MRLHIASLALSCLALSACSSSPTETKSSAGAGGASATGATPATTSGSGGNGGSGGAASVPFAGTVTHYDYTFDIVTHAGESLLSITAAAPGGNCFDVGCGLPADAVTWDGVAALTSNVESSVLNACGASIAGGASLTLGASVVVPKKTFFNGLNVGYSELKDMAGGTFSYMLSWIGGCSNFGPCDADPARLATFHINVNHPVGTVALCPGARTDGATQTKCDIASTLAPTYSAFGLAADSKWVREPFISVDGVNLVFFEVPGGKLMTTLEPPSATAYIQWITGLLGPLPYGTEMRYAGGPTEWLGFEHPANVIMREGLPDEPMAYANPTMHVFMHETVHQWAGDRATIATVPDFVWKEATAEYLAYVFEDENRPPVEAASSLAYWDSISLQSEHYPRPTDDPPPAVQTFYGDVYGPGPMTLYVQLESLLGRDKVLAGIAAFLSAPGSKSVKDLEMAIETASSQDLSAYFTAWVFGKGAPEWPTFMTSTSQVGDQVTVTVTQVNPSNTIYGCKLEVEVDGASQSVTADVNFGIAPMSATATATVTLAQPVTGTVNDPNHRIVGRDAMTKADKKKSPQKQRVWIL